MKEFSYGKTGIVLSILPAIMIVILLILLLVAILALGRGLYSFLVGLPLDIKPVMEAVLLFLSCIIILPEVLGFINQHNTIHVIEGGLSITTFGPFLLWKFIPWQDITGIEISPRLDRWRQPVWIIKVRKLTLWHKYLGKLYNVGFSPIITLTSDMKNRYHLMEIIEQNCPNVRK